MVSDIVAVEWSVQLITTLTLTVLLVKTSLNLPSLTMGHSAYDGMNRPHSWHPPSLHTLKDWWDKSNVTWFLRGQTSKKNCQCKKSWLSLFILDNRQWQPCHLKENNVKIWVEVNIVTFFVCKKATVDVLMANSEYDVNLAKTRYVYHCTN